MSTFDGIVDEFPDIRIDYFRTHPGKGPPSACFLSHVHSDHLLGLESLKMPFVYCSAATKKILLRMEKYPHRINFQKGILETRKQTYKHLKKILRELPLQTPIELELRPKTTIRATLFDANHCPGAVMFLIEGSGKAILYTGDIRAESWWVNSIVRNPILLPYSCGHKSLDCIYLDTTFASHNDVYKVFPSKAEGLKQLLTKVTQCPKSSVFYFRAWTLGYEEVWVMLSNVLGSRIHVEEYQVRLFGSSTEDACRIDQGAALTGCAVGNQIQAGCLTTDSNVSIHSCEPGMECHTELSNKSNVVWITPIISTLSDGTEVAEIGAGGGGGDMYQVPELAVSEVSVMQALRQFCISNIEDTSVLNRLEEVFEESNDRHNFKISLEGLGLDPDQEVSLDDFIKLVSSEERVTGRRADRLVGRKGRGHRGKQQVIHFPFSRHSSFSELRHLLSSFRPKDICPCTVDMQSWSEDLAMESLFGDLCVGKVFRYDEHTRKRVEELQEVKSMKFQHKGRQTSHDSQETASQGSSSEHVYKSAQVKLSTNRTGAVGHDDSSAQSRSKNNDEVIIIDDRSTTSELDDYDDNMSGMSDISILAEAFDSHRHDTRTSQSDGMEEREMRVTRSEAASRQESRRTRIDAYQRARSCLSDHNVEQWNALHLRSTGWKGHTEEEMLL